MVVLVQHICIYLAKGPAAIVERSRIDAIKAGFMDNNDLNEFGTHNSDGWKCNRKECLKDGHKKVTVAAHVKKHHPLEPLEESIIKLRKDRYKCKWCDNLLMPYQTEEAYKFKRHCNQHHQGNFKV